MVRSTWRALFLATALMGFVSCSSGDETAQPYSDKSMKTVECKYRVSTCYMKASERCSREYRVVGEVRSERTGGPYGTYKVYVVKYLCL